MPGTNNRSTSTQGDVTVTQSEVAALALVDLWLDYRARCLQAPGFQLCIRKDGAVIHAASYGKANIKLQRPMRNSDYLALGSQTKSFTACITLQLIEKGVLSFATMIGDIVPELRECADKRIPTVTIEQLLMHRGGFTRDYADTIFDETFTSDNPDKDYAHVVNHVKGCALVYPPGTKTKYSNLGYALIGYVIERHTGMSYQQLVDTYINDKLGTDFTTCQNLDGRQVATGYSGQLGDGLRYTMSCAPMQAATAAAGLYGTALDTSLFFHEYMYGDRLLGDAMGERLHSDAHVVINFPASRYGYALIHGRANGTSYLGHVGESPGFACQTFAIDDGKYLISISMNTGEIFIRDMFPNITGILLHMNKQFAAQEPIYVTPAMADRRGAFAVAANTTHALHVPLDTWTPYRLATELQAAGDGSFVSTTQDGYWNVDEAMHIIRDNRDKVCMVQWGAMVARDEQTFLSRYSRQA